MFIHFRREALKSEKCTGDCKYQFRHRLLPETKFPNVHTKPFTRQQLSLLVTATSTQMHQ